MNISHYYELLGLKPGASEEEIKEAYRDLSKVWHPDRFTNDPGLQQKAREKLKEINEAYQKIQDYLQDSQFLKTESEQSTQSKGSSQSDTGASEDRVRDNAQPPPEPPKETMHPDESSRQRDIQLKDNISYKYLPFIFAVFIGGTCYNLFSTSSRIDNAIIGGISFGLGAAIGYGVTKGINSLKVSKGKKVVIAWMVGIVGLFIFSSIPVLLFNTKSKDTSVKLDFDPREQKPAQAPDQAPIINEVISDEEIKQAKNLLNNKDWQGLLNLSQQLIRVHPNDSNAWNYLGLAYSYLQQYDQAIQAFNEALRIAPNDPILNLNRGSTYLESSQFDMAISDYSKAIAINPNLSTAYLGRGYSYYNKSDYKRALSDFQKACKMGDKSACESLKNIKLKQELDYYQRKLESENSITNKQKQTPESRYRPSESEFWYNQGVTSYKDGKYDSAIEYFNKSIASRDSAETYTYRGLAYYKTGQYDKAIEDFTKVIEIEPTNRLAYFNRGSTYYKKGQHDIAVVDFQKACNLGDEDGCKKLKIILGKNK